MKGRGGRRVVVLLSGTGRSLENLFRARASGELDFELPLVVSSRRGVRGLEVAAKEGAGTAVVARRDYLDDEGFSAALEGVVAAARPDAVVMAGFLSRWIQPKALEGRVINIHPSLLPLFGGKGFWGHRVHEAVIASGMRVSGCTVHFVDDAYDHGAVILQRSCRVLPDDDAETLAARVFAEECRALPMALRWLLAGEVRLEAGRAKYGPAALAELGSA